jgi:hypothetical protein
MIPFLSSPIVLKQFSTFNKDPKKKSRTIQEMTKDKDNETLPNQIKSLWESKGGTPKPPKLNSYFGNKESL